MSHGIIDGITEENNRSIRRLASGSGDDGTTVLADGSRIAKSDPVVELLGELDELNAVCGVLRECTAEQTVRRTIRRFQQLLVLLSSACAGSSDGWHKVAAVAEVEEQLAVLFKQGAVLPDQFLLPGDRAGSGRLHWARTVCRRCERHAWLAADSVPEQGAVFLNRLSDWFFLADCPGEPQQPGLF